MNPDGTLGRKGFQGLMTSVLRKFQMRQIAKAMGTKTWGEVTVQSTLMGTMALLREVFSIT
jgi:hypothetical protein